MTTLKAAGGSGKMARPARFERTTVRLEGGCSIQLSYGRNCPTVAVPPLPRKRNPPARQASHRSGPAKFRTKFRKLDVPAPKSYIEFRSVVVAQW